MSLRHAVLGFLQVGPLTGYDLKKLFDRSVRHFWPADRAQIYRTLADLTECGWATVELVPQEGKPAQKVHSLTKTGSEEFKRWLASPQPPADVREATLIQIFFADALSDTKALTALQSQRTAMQTQLDRLRALAPSTTRRPGTRRMARQNFFRHLTLDHGIAVTAAEIEWLDSAIARLEEHTAGNWSEAE